ncbi:hypothetical protein HUS82_26855 [Pseudomonas protegens]|nr:hypothetical protein [Pseudomonas protegens]QTU24040.1 hypothetical protein HUT21_06655 [Pseudomonas protegens]QTU33571.1 hypothetical protein HUT20_24560 [Pseudomonas protegens]RLO24086.1 hypothetical protein EAG75_08935 [Pseudomonas protegens]ROM15516.1 hypothetical protein BK643_23535 [Pseudomonas protegens]
MAARLADMPLIFRAPPELRVELDILGYQFPGSHDHLDANWLMVQGRIEHPQGDWRFKDACLRTHELDQLAQWLQALDQPEGPPRPCWFTEPCLAFHYLGGPEPQIQIHFCLEAAPPWLNPEQRLDGCQVTLPLACNSVSRLLAGVDALRRDFPQR